MTFSLRKSLTMNEEKLCLCWGDAASSDPQGRPSKCAVGKRQGGKFLMESQGEQWMFHWYPLSSMACLCWVPPSLKHTPSLVESLHLSLTLFFCSAQQTRHTLQLRSARVLPAPTPTSGKGTGGWKLEGSSRPPTTVGGALDLGRAVHAWRWSKQIWDGEITFKATYSPHAGKG